MKALIFNSGLGSRLDELTEHNPKCLVKLASGETIFHRQLRVLSSCGIKDFVVTTGPWPELVEAATKEFGADGCTFSFVRNDRYNETNYIYSMWLARDLLRGDEVLLLHGDLVFDAAYVRGLLALPAGSYGSVDPTLPVPDKDFSAEVVDGEVCKVGVGIEGHNLTAFQAMYRLAPESMDVWLDAVEEFIVCGQTGVYAENAANTVFRAMHVAAHPYTGHVLEEIDTKDDLARVSDMIRMRDFADQPVFELADGMMTLAQGAAGWSAEAVFDLPSLFAALDVRRPLVVADPFFGQRMADVLDGALAGLPLFANVMPNPGIEQVAQGVEAYRAYSCDSVVSLGGGSAIDVAKCVAAVARAGERWQENLLDGDSLAALQPVSHVAIPSTAGTGSESTHFAVVYVEGAKVSVAADRLLPQVAVLCPSLLEGLPRYQRASTMLDALCHVVESYWSARSCVQSRVHAARAIKTIMKNRRSYLEGDAAASRSMMFAANQAGRAINITTTTAAHAMCYGVTSRFGIAHGHAAALCLPACWKALLDRGSAGTRERLAELDVLLTDDPSASIGSGLAAFEELLCELDLPKVGPATEEDIALLARGVNAQRLANFPLVLSQDEVRALYKRTCFADMRVE